MAHPASHGLIGHEDPTLSQQILDVAEAQGEPDIKPDRLLDDFGREAVAAITDVGHHEADATQDEDDGQSSMSWRDSPTAALIALESAAPCIFSCVRYQRPVSEPRARVPMKTGAMSPNMTA